MLIENGTDINAKNYDGDTALIYASQNGYTEIVKLLIQAGIDVNARYTNGVTALMLASKNNHADTVKLLLELGADISAKDMSEYTVLGHAISTTYLFSSGKEEENSSELVKILILNGANFNLNTHNYTVLM